MKTKKVNMTAVMHKWLEELPRMAGGATHLFISYAFQKPITRLPSSLSALLSRSLLLGYPVVYQLLCFPNSYQLGYPIVYQLCFPEAYYLVTQ